jgi:hypothetical protein
MFYFLTFASGSLFILCFIVLYVIHHVSCNSISAFLFFIFLEKEPLLHLPVIFLMKYLSWLSIFDRNILILKYKTKYIRPQ